MESRVRALSLVPWRAMLVCNMFLLCCNPLSVQSQFRVIRYFAHFLVCVWTFALVVLSFLSWDDSEFILYWWELLIHSKSLHFCDLNLDLYFASAVCYVAEHETTGSRIAKKGNLKKSPGVGRETGRATVGTGKFSRKHFWKGVIPEKESSKTQPGKRRNEQQKQRKVETQGKTSGHGNWWRTYCTYNISP